MIKLFNTVYGWLKNAYFIISVVCSGKSYKISYLRKIRLIAKIYFNTKRIKSLSTWRQHLVLAQEMLNIHKSIKGDVIECGCYMGASTANLSLVCSLVNRKPIVCDSFAGLPEPSITEKYEIHADSKDYYIWEKGTSVLI